MTKFGISLLALSAAAAPGARAHVFRAAQEAEETTSLTIVSASSEQADGDASGGPTITVPEYSSDQCQIWLSGVLAADADGSGGLSEEEFHDFLQDIDDPPYISEFFDKHSESYLALPWLFKVAHKSLACICHRLGGGDECCRGPNAEIPFVGLRDDPDERQGLTAAQLQVAAEYRADMCNSVAAVFEEVVPEPLPTASPVVAPVVTEPTDVVDPGVTAPDPTPGPTKSPVKAEVPATPGPTKSPVKVEVSDPAPCGPGTELPCPAEPAPLGLDIVGSVIDYSSFDYSLIFQRRLEIPDYYNAEEILTNKDDNNILADVITGFGILSNQLLVSLPAADAEGGGGRKLRGGRELQTTMAELRPVVVTDISCPEGLPYAPKDTFCINYYFEFKSDPENDNLMGSLITELEAAIDQGVLYEVIKEERNNTLVTGMGSPGKGVNYLDGTDDPSSVNTQPMGDTPAEEESGGLSTVAIIIIIIAVICIPVASLALYSRHKKIEDEKRMQRLAEYNAKRDLEASREVPQAGPADDDSSDGGSYVDVEDGKASASRSAAGSSLAAMGAAGAAATIPRSASPKREKEEVRRSIIQLVDETNAPKTADELLATYAGREEELVGHLEKMKSKQMTNSQIRSLVDKTKAPKSADELLAAYAGREDELLNHLKKMEAKQDKKAEVVELVAAASPGKSAEELLSAYNGREDELIKNLKKMQAGQLRASQLTNTKKSIRNLVDETAPGKTADELLATYDGREEELLKNLEKMKSKQELKSSQRESIRQLVDETKPGKTADELLATYSGREDELLKNLEKMKSKQELKSSKQASVKALVDEVQPGKTSDELLATYAGREDELIKNLEKMKDKKERSALKASKQASVKALVDETKPGKSAEELLALYDGKEDDLIKNLEKMKTKQSSARAAKHASVRQLVDETNPGKSAEELLAMYDGKEDDLIKNLEKMKAKKEKKSEADVRAQALASAKAEKHASVRQLVDETNPGKSAEELLAMYDGKEDDLITNLEKMKAKQEKKASKAAEMKASKHASIRQLVDETMPGKSADELLSMYDGKEDQLIKNLEKMKSKQLVKDKANKQQSVRQLVDETDPGKTADELLTMYEGKEDELIKNLTKMKTKKDKKAAAEEEAREQKRATITSLVAETNPGKSAEELLAAYDGKEDELLKNLTKMKSKQDMRVKKEKQASVRALVEETNPGKSAEELLAAYDGKEDELIKNLNKMKSKREMSKKKSVSFGSEAKTAAAAPAAAPAPAASAIGTRDMAVTRRMVQSLVAETNPGKSADDLLKAYEGREQELVNHLSKLKASKRRS